MLVIQNYIKALQRIDFSKDSEHSLRFELKNLLENHSNRKVNILHHGKREGKFGAPDFKISDEKGIVGYVETKKSGENLEHIIKSEQIKKYIQLSDNLLLTNYLEFIWIRKGKIELRESLCFLSDLQNKKFQVSTEKENSTENVINQFLKENSIGIGTAKELAHALATRTKILKDFLRETIQYQTDSQQQSPLTGLYNTFKTSISTDLTVSEFSDAFAQMLSYGIFLAKLNADSHSVAGEALSLRNAKYFIPKSFELIHELVGFIDNLENDEYTDTRWIVEEIITILNNIDVISIQSTLSFNKNKFTPQLSENFELSESYELSESWKSDPYLYFYEEFLSVYDAKLRKAKGVYYTPPEIVGFIIRGAGKLLETEFGVNQQFADSKKVTVLDFATGTGTFVLEILKQILDSVPENSTQREILIREHILKNIYGFEYLIAPYTIAHLKLSQFLKDNNYEMQPKERLQIYLTNTIEPLNTQYNAFVQALSKEGVTAQKIKEKPILVITGNPPYSASSSNKNQFILNLINDYKKDLNERSLNSLSDDYVKFIRFAHHKIEKTGNGIVAVITNNSYLDGIVFRKMRQKLFEDFDKIYIINLHGNSLKKEGDENVFDIRVGVSILFLIKSEKPIANKEIFYFSTKDNNLITRKQKFDYFKSTNLDELPFEKLKLSEPYFWFTNKNIDKNSNYYKFWNITDIFKVYSVGVGTKVDKISVDTSKTRLSERVQIIINNKFKLGELIREYSLNEKTTWEYNRALKTTFDENKITEYDYRPFDQRYVFYDNNFLSRSRKEVMDNFFNKQNIAIIAPRQSKLPDYRHAFIAKNISDESFLAGGRDLGAGVVFPLYLYSEQNGNGNGLLFEKQAGRKLNYTDDFKSFIQTHFTENVENESLRNELNNLEENLQEQQQILEMLLAGKSLLIEQQQNIIADIELNINQLKQQAQNNTTNYQPSGEEVFYYIYAVLHSPTYREKYIEFLKIDFPKIPFVKSLAVFQKLSKLGEKLANAHLLNEIPAQNIGEYPEKGTNEVTKIEWANNCLYFNQKQFFGKVSEDIFNFKIGSYQVLAKYLKERKQQILSTAELERIIQIINIINFTLKQMEEIDEAYLKINLFS